jgi:uncharacterized protein YjiS (DUF1127 family)
MTIFSVNIARLPELIGLNFLRWKRHHFSTDLEKLSDRSLKDIGLRPTGRDYEAVKPFWMP